MAAHRYNAIVLLSNSTALIIVVLMVWYWLCRRYKQF